MVTARLQSGKPCVDSNPNWCNNTIVLGRPPRGVHLAVDFVPPSSTNGSLSGTTFTVHYELYDGLPVLRKWVTVSVAANAPHAVTVDTLMYEFLRAPNFAPERMTVVTQHANNPTPNDQQVPMWPYFAF